MTSAELTTSPTSPYLSTRTTGAVLEVTLDRPDQLNAQLPSMWTAMAAIGRELDDDVRVVVVRGAGRAFSAGLDRRMFGREPVEGETNLLAGELTDSGGEAVIADFQAGFAWLRDPRIVSIAAVHGHAIGAGFQLALACDLRVLADDAQLTMAETGLGLVPDLGGTLPLVEAVGYSRALELCVTGRRMGAAEAYAAGLATVVVPAGELDRAVSDLVAAVTSPRHGAVTATKALLREALTNTADQQLAAERRAQIGRLQELGSLG